MRARTFGPLALLLFAGCSHSPTHLAGDCVNAALVGDNFYVAAARATPTAVGPEFARTTRQRECEDVILYGRPLPAKWQNGDSSFPSGTPLFTSTTEPASQLLLIANGDGSYTELRPLALIN
jgi:hypothetical protein